MFFSGVAPLTEDASCDVWRQNSDHPAGGGFVDEDRIGGVLRGGAPRHLAANLPLRRAYAEGVIADVPITSIVFYTFNFPALDCRKQHPRAPGNGRRKRSLSACRTDRMNDLDAYRAAGNPMFNDNRFKLGIVGSN